MKLVTIVPFLKSLQKETLTYFSAKDVQIGDIVIAPVRKKDVKGLVIDVSSVGTQKGDIKEADFNLKKIKEVLGQSIILPSFLKSAEEIKDYFVCSTGGVLNTFLPKTIFENYENLPQEKPEDYATGGLIRERFAFGAPREDRLVIYRTYLRESFAKKESVFFCFPSIGEAKFFQENISKGIEKYSFFFHSGLSKKDLVKKYTNLMQEKHPIAVFSTPSFLFLPRNDFGTLIIENENASGYTSAQKPYIDARIFAETLSKNQNTKIIFADSLLRTETIWRVKSGELLEFRPINWRLPEKEEEDIVDMSQEEKDFKILSKKSFMKIKKAEQEGESTLIFTLRKGYATSTICNDCGKAVIKNGEPLILFEGENGNRFFKTNKSQKIYSADITCEYCQSWNLAPLGIGTEKIKEEVLRIKDAEKVFVLDKNTAGTEKKIKDVVKKFQNTKDGVLIATEIALPHLDQKVDNIIVASFDTLFNIPSWNIYEKVINLLVLLNTKTKKSILIQTRNSDEEVLQDIKNRNLIKFWKDDIENRKKWQYPPFFTLIKVEYTSSAKEKSQVAKYLKETYVDWNPLIKEKILGANKFKITMLLKIPKEEWNGAKVNKEILEKLRFLPPYWTIQINPSLLV